MSNVRTTQIARMLATCVQHTKDAAADVPDHNRYRQLEDGKGHPAWYVGHLAGALNTVFLRWTCGKECAFPDAYNKMFMPGELGGNPITKDPDDYPDWDEVYNLYCAIGAAAIEAMGDLADEDLDKTPPGMPEMLKQYFPTVEAVANYMVIHDSYHRGQMVAIGKLS